MGVMYGLEIVGGPFDGAPGMAWFDDGCHEPPDAIYLGMCGKGRRCTLSTCELRRQHISYWTEDEDDRPPSAVSYALQSTHIEEDDDVGHGHGRATYTIGGLHGLTEIDAREMVPAGAA